ncbi:MAG: efflux RND transporter permease subunit [Salinisphaera sp.]|nr:efflux RND transporter permease subunit [Salinisphaera sp.]
MGKRFTDLFIDRPVLATVVSLLILLVGLRAYMSLTVRQYPESNKAVIVVQTVYTGASAELIKGFITTPLEKVIASADGIDYIESTSRQGVSIINVHLDLNYPPYKALTQITSKVNQVRSDLPQDALAPTLEVQVGDTTASMYMSFTSKSMTPSEITDYLYRVVVPELSAIAGVQSAAVLGGAPFAMRIWLEPDKLAAYGLTAADIYARLQANNYLAAVGQTKGNLVRVTFDAATTVHDVESFSNLVVKEVGASTVTLGEVAEIDLGAESYATSAIFNGRKGPFIGVKVLPTANALTVIEAVREKFPEIVAAFPPALDGVIVYDATKYIEDAIKEVAKTLGEALLIVTVVIFLFLGSLRTVVIPIVAMPLSLIGAGIVMMILGFSVNLLTLLGLVLAIGLVVDDAIIVVENIHRHMEGERISPYQAAIRGTRELALPIVAMSITLIAVYLPIGFIGGLTGNLFAEFAFTVAGAVFISGIVALTLSPMLCSKVLKPESEGGGSRFAHWLDRRFETLRGWYARRLHATLDYRPVTYVFAATILASCYFLFTNTATELAPYEDQGILFISATAQPNASLNQTEFYTQKMHDVFFSFPETDDQFLINGFSFNGLAPFHAVSGMKLKPWSERDRTPAQLRPLVTAKLGKIAGLQAAVFMPAPLPGASGLPVQFVIGTTAPPEELLPVAQEMAKRARESGLFLYSDIGLKFDRPQIQLHIDRDKAAALGLTMRDIGTNLGAMLSGAYVNRFSIQGRSYKVIPQVVRAERISPEQLRNYYIRAENGELVPMSSVVSLEPIVQPRKLTRFQQLNATILTAIPLPGVTQGQALAFLKAQAAEVFPDNFRADYAGQSRQYMSESGALVTTFFFAVIVIFLVLAAQFESFRDPAIILVSVPMSISGALVFLMLGFATINIYTQVGMITLIGLISKHGILIVEFANQLQRTEGLDKRAAIEKAAGIRLRPILMTTAAMVAGVMPLILAGGAGAASRFSIGLVIATGMAIGTLFTIFVVPAMYMLLGGEHAQEHEHRGLAEQGESAPQPS